MTSPRTGFRILAVLAVVLVLLMTLRAFDGAWLQVATTGMTLLVPSEAKVKAAYPLVAQADGVVTPEDVGVHDGAGHPGLVTAEADDLEGLIGDPKRRLAKAHDSRSLKAKTAVVMRRSFQEDGGNAAFVQQLQSVMDEAGPDAAALLLRQDGNGAENGNVDESPSRVDPTAREQDMTRNVAVSLGHERDRVGVLAELFQKWHNTCAVLAERCKVQCVHGVLVLAPLETNVHVRILAPPPRTAAD